MSNWDKATAIKIYKPLCYVKLKNGEVLFASLEHKQNIINDANDTKVNLVMVEGKAVSRFDIVEIDEYIAKDDLHIFIASRNSEERRALVRREEQKRARLGRGFDDVHEAIRWLERRQNKEVTI